MAEEIKVRVAVPEDMDEVMKVALAACDENGFLNPNPAKLAADRKSTRLNSSHRT